MANASRMVFMEVGTNIDGAKTCLAVADCVCFDVDSTVITTEGIDDLAAYLGVGDQVAALTASAMGGSVPFHEALTARLQLMPHTKAQLTAMLAAEPIENRLTPGIGALVAQLVAKGCDVYLVSGGFRQMIEPIAAYGAQYGAPTVSGASALAVGMSGKCDAQDSPLLAIGLPNDHIYANTLLYNAAGLFVGHDEAEPTSRAGGKAAVVASLRASKGYKTVVMVGDGATDMEARDTEGGADAFIGFGGVQVREKVQKGADWYVDSFHVLADVLKPPEYVCALKPKLCEKPPTKRLKVKPAPPEEEVRHFSLFQ